MEDAFLGAKGTLPNRGEGSPCTQLVNPRQTSIQGRQAGVASDTSAMRSTAGTILSLVKLASSGWQNRELPSIALR